MLLDYCPACKSKAELIAGSVCCTNRACRLLGPCDDLDGYKWNALPRHGDSRIITPAAPIRIDVPESMPVRLHVAAILLAGFSSNANNDGSVTPEIIMKVADTLISAEKASRK